MFYTVFAVVIIAIGAVNIDPLIAWMEDRSMPTIAMTSVIIVSMGVIPAFVIGAGIIGDTVRRGDRKR